MGFLVLFIFGPLVAVLYGRKGREAVGTVAKWIGQLILLAIVLALVMNSGVPIVQPTTQPIPQQEQRP